MKVSARLLCSYYIICPLCLVIVLADVSVFNGQVRNALPSSPFAILWFSVFFSLPHVIASNLTFLDREYLRSYRNNLLLAVAISIGFVFFLPAAFGPVVFLYLYSFWTALHVHMQQLGINKAYLKGGTPVTFRIWRDMGALAYALAYFDFLEAEGMAPDALFSPFVEGLAPLFAVVTTMLAAYIVFKAPPGTGRLYTFCNQAYLFTALWTWHLGYGFFAILIPRVLHDVTAFTFYIAHDSNRNAGEVKQFTYRLLKATGIPVAVLCPLVAVSAGLVFLPGINTHFYSFGIFEKTALALAVMHYVTEFSIWKSGSLHRQHIGPIAA